MFHNHKDVAMNPGAQPSIHAKAGQITCNPASRRQEKQILDPVTGQTNQLVISRFSERLSQKTRLTAIEERFPGTISGFYAPTCTHKYVCPPDTYTQITNFKSKTCQLKRRLILPNSLQYSSKKYGNTSK